MTSTHPRDPRMRRHNGGVVDSAAAAVRLEVAADAMRAALTTPEPEPLTAETFAELLERPPPLEPVTCADLLTSCQHTGPHVPVGLDGAAVAEFAEPAPVESLPPAPPAPAPAVFSTERRALTWASRHDPQSLSFGVRAVLPGSAPLADRLWPVGPVLDQGAEGECVGCAVADAWNAMHPADVAGPLVLEDAGELYHAAQQLDEVPGEDYSGTSVLAGMKAGVAAGLFGGYRWAFGTRDVAQAVLQLGPVVVGVPWLSGMYDTGPGGLVTVTGADTGQGHCLAVVGLKLKGPQGQPGPFFVWQNSWGPSYGDGGLGYIHHRDLAELLHGTGEAAIPMPGPQR